MPIRKLIWFPLALLLALVAGSCGEDDETPTLGPNHEGWDDPGCWGSDCHDQDDTHHSDLRPFECVECHGINGAPSGHGGDTPCGDCHPDQHGNNGFPDPESCQTCH